MKKIKILAHAKHQTDPAKRLKQSIEKIEGKQNCEVVITNNKQEKYDNSFDLHVIWGARKNKAEFMKGKFLVMERSYILDRYQWVSLGYDGLNGYADFLPQFAKIDRWNKHFEKHMKPWKDNTKETGKYVLIAGQVFNDQSIKHLNVENVYRDTIVQLIENGYEVLFRQHPMEKRVISIDKMGLTKNQKKKLKIITQSQGVPLTKNLNEAKFVVTINSNVGVDCIMHGVPVVTLDKGSMVYEITSHDLNKPYYKPPEKLLHEWKKKMGYTQWLPEEISNGEAWQHLRKGL